ncbi:MAG: amino acid racemase [Coriobacteriales bacterium]|jgi:aspartate racemase|nr:amino acid racemase [Coriobacteriales bacterium]
MHKPVLGILGGVGPLATAYFMELLIKKTPAHTDQDHMPMIVFNDPQIPDRTAYILDHEKPNPQGEMAKVARWLEEAGSDYIAIACNTAHYFYDAINEAVSIPVVNIMEETSERISSLVLAGSNVGLLATEGTVESGVFQGYFERYGLRCMAPDPDGQARISHLIYDCVKANQPYDEQEFLEEAYRLRDAGCEAVVVGCTELSVIYQELERKPRWLLDSLDILADRCVQIYQQARAKDGHIEM